MKDHEGNYTHENRTVVSSGLPLNTDQDSWYFKIIYNTLVDRFFDGNKQNPTSNFSNYGNDESITFIDPTFEKVTSCPFFRKTDIV